MATATDLINTHAAAIVLRDKTQDLIDLYVDRLITVPEFIRAMAALKTKLDSIDTTGLIDPNTGLRI